MQGQKFVFPSLSLGSAEVISVSPFFSSQSQGEGGQFIVTPFFSTSLGEIIKKRVPSPFVPSLLEKEICPMAGERII